MESFNLASESCQWHAWNDHISTRIHLNKIYIEVGFDLLTGNFRGTGEKQSKFAESNVKWKPSSAMHLQQNTTEETYQLSS